MDRVHAHLRAYLRAVGGLPGGVVDARDGMLWSRTSIPWPMFNGAVATPELGACAAADEVAGALADGALPCSCGCCRTRPRT